MELTINQLIKIIIGAFVVVLVISGLYFFAENIKDFFKNIPGGNLSKLILSFLY